MDNAYMIRNDGELFPIKAHVYVRSDDIDESLNAATWLFEHTKSAKTKNLVLTFIHSWAYKELSDGGFKDMSALVHAIQDYIEEIGEDFFGFFNTKFLRDNKDGIFKAPVMDDVDGFSAMVGEELNQEFLRARYGGMYDSLPTSKEMVFRISSTDFDWFNIIYTFVADHAAVIKSVTVCADEESIGRKSYFYEYKGQKFQQMPVDDFLSMSGTPIMESLQAVKTVPLFRNGILFSHGLSQGYSIMESLNTRKNINRIVYDYMRMRAFHLPYSFIRDK